MAVRCYQAVAQWLPRICGQASRQSFPITITWQEHSTRMDVLKSISTPVKEKSVRLIQISDCHLGSGDSESLLGLDTDRSLSDVLTLIAAEHRRIDWLVCTGDITSSGDNDGYSRFVKTVRQHFSAPLAWLPGNHDSAAAMANIQADELPESRVILLDNWLVILLDSSVPGEVYGELEATELEFLQQTLTRYPDKHVMVMLHHQPVPVGSAWIDAYILRNAADFFAIIDGNPRVKTVVWGHVHQQFMGQRKHITLLGSPSTSVQFKPGCDDFTVDTSMPGYRWFDLGADGSFETGVSRVMAQDYPIDYQSGGY